MTQLSKNLHIRTLSVSVRSKQQAQRAATAALWTLGLASQATYRPPLRWRLFRQ